jgi:predicted ATP-grasp superfamily ATP-dependent carboligase
MSEKAVLFLVHQGFSFIDDLIQLSNRYGFKAYVLSSKPQSTNSDRVEHLAKIASVCKVTESPFLKQTDLQLFLRELELENKRPLLCMSVWEAYRILMAQTNQILGACDESSEILSILLDKFVLRSRLNELGLSKIKTEQFDSFSLPQWNGQKQFIKPRNGLGSFGAFPWQGEPLDKKIKTILTEMTSDADYAGVFKENPVFVVEDEIQGCEYSFEVIVENGRSAFLGVHEKLDVQIKYGSVLENACVSPPIELSESERVSGLNFVEEVLLKLNIKTGCYHIEAKYNAGTWEIIEINPRVGGSYIYQSTKWVSGKCLLALWMQTLLRDPQCKLLEKDYRSNNKSFFRVFYGAPGRTINKIEISNKVKSPDLFRQIARVGIVLPDSSREIFVGQALWLLNAETNLSEIEALNQQSLDYMDISYAN